MQEKDVAGLLLALTKIEAVSPAGHVLQEINGVKQAVSALGVRGGWEGVTDAVFRLSVSLERERNQAAESGRVIDAAPQADEDCGVNERASRGARESSFSSATT